jgi:dienelactone hydrolase
MIASVVFSSGAVASDRPVGDDWLKRPVDDRTLETYLEFFRYDQNVPFELRVLDVQQDAGLTREHLSFQSTPGVRVFADVYVPPAADLRKLPAVILLHGGSALGKRSERPLARLLTRGGRAVLAMDMQYFGERSTGLLTTFTEQDKHDRLYNQPSVYLAWVAQTAKDVGRAFDLLVRERGVDSKRIGLFGTSRGASIGAIVGGADRRLAVVVLLLGGHFDALETGHLPAACPANYIGRISPRPLLMLNALYDTDQIKATSVEPLYDLARPPRQILWSETGHAFPTEKNQAVMLQWLRENLK